MSKGRYFEQYSLPPVIEKRLSATDTDNNKLPRQDLLAVFDQQDAISKESALTVSRVKDEIEQQATDKQVLRDLPERETYRIALNELCEDKILAKHKSGNANGYWKIPHENGKYRRLFYWSIDYVHRPIKKLGQITIDDILTVNTFTRVSAPLFLIGGLLYLLGINFARPFFITGALYLLFGFLIDRYASAETKGILTD